MASATAKNIAKPLNYGVGVIQSRLACRNNMQYLFYLRRRRRCRLGGQAKARLELRRQRAALELRQVQVAVREHAQSLFDGLKQFNCLRSP